MASNYAPPGAITTLAAATDTDVLDAASADGTSPNDLPRTSVVFQSVSAGAITFNFGADASTAGFTAAEGQLLVFNAADFPQVKQRLNIRSATGGNVCVMVGTA